MGEYFVNEVSKKIWEDRYRKNKEAFDGNIRRVAKRIADSEKEECKEQWENEFYKAMVNGLFFPAGRTMSNAGIGKDLTLNNCFVSPYINDDLCDIFDKVKLAAKTHQKGGGLGHCMSYLRPKDTPTSNDAIASGPVSFADVFNAQTATIMQGSRRK